MDIKSLNCSKNYIVGLLVLLFTIIALWIRLIPAEGLVTDVGVNLLGNDPWYNLRQIEVMVANPLEYPWFDPMTHYPTGTHNFWGPLYPMIGAIMCILAGASTRTDVMYVASYMPALMGAAMVPLMYMVGSKISDWKGGILASLFMVFVAGQYIYRSMFGFVDHHIAEVLFSTLFCLVYLFYLAYTREHEVDLKSADTLKVPCLIAVFAGITYLLGLFVMPTMILFALIVAIYTGLQFIWDRVKGKRSDYLLLVNVVTFAIAIIGFLALGIQHDGMSMARYSMGHIFAYLALIVATLVLYAFSVFFVKRPLSHYIASLAGLAVAGFLFIMVAMPEFYSFFISSLGSFFGYTATLTTIEEARHWNFDQAWLAFNYGLILMALGFVAVLYKFVKESKQTYLFAFVWSLMILYSTTVQLRYEYYLAANIALLSGLFVGWTLDFGAKEFSKLSGGNAKPVVTESPETGSGEKTVRKGGKKDTKKPVSPKKSSVDPVYLAPAVLGVVLALMFLFTSVQADIGLANGLKNSGMIPDWEESLVWLGENTPEPGIDYYEVYDRKTYQNPSDSYGVMTWWDYGHWITFVAKRAPNSNPFQEGVAGPNGAAAYFIQMDESESDKILDNLNTRYVITDGMMADSKFWAMSTWYNSTVMNSPYEAYFAVRTQDGTIGQLKLNMPDYYNTMIARLHNLDGSMAEGNSSLYVEYTDGSAYGVNGPLLTKYEILPSKEAFSKAAQINSAGLPGTRAAVLGENLLTPPDYVPALEHYRLIHESPTNTISNGELKFVKVFEYVKGARIKGEGTIELKLVSDQGREFTYKQRSVDGEFIVPYSTTKDNYGTKVSGDYRITETGKTFSVSEDAVMDGLLVN
ncbi:oligosaccharyl transferase, archaeosortase A system-associated [Methanoplanus sp. FWC-SCC4]|uniref:dolichyl-phosphooligosaccharide-protein glycotransferase n=1 Tax=Methanochimaera problematica TaxID=2609417 RepID=A0AA97FEI9_9EURY|nr:oligosaccharyl transferase, archaeosortase A system-associated [Methanoplanus sp. FWC-SCC4]WOF17087.1 oligosaccharyl transferase, archaeosortase A system-associated [Methanoplanus sp. FWC-SCC4]